MKSGGMPEKKTPGPSWAVLQSRRARAGAPLFADLCGSIYEGSSVYERKYSMVFDVNND